VGPRDGNVRAFGLTEQSAQSQPPSRSTTNADPARPDRERSHLPSAAPSSSVRSTR